MATAYGPHKTLYNRWKRWSNKAGMNTRPYTIDDSRGRPPNLFVATGKVSDGIGSRDLLSSLPDVDCRFGDRGYVADWFGEALQDKGIRASARTGNNARNL